jgi:hypothetical protein
MAIFLSGSTVQARPGLQGKVRFRIHDEGLLIRVYLQKIRTKLHNDRESLNNPNKVKQLDSLLKCSQLVTVEGQIL